MYLRFQRHDAPRTRKDKMDKLLELFKQWWNDRHNPYRTALTVNYDEVAQAAFIAGYKAKEAEINK